MSTRFAVAVHILAVLQLRRGTPVASDRIAASVNTNPVVVRRILSMLKKAGLVSVQLGTGGGALLGRPGAEISLEQVYRAVEEAPLFATHREEPSCECPVGRNILPVLEKSTRRAESALFAELARVDVAQIARQITGRERRASS